MGETSFNISDLKKLYADSSASQNSIELCYSRDKVLVKPLKILDKKELLKSIESKNEDSMNRVLDNIITKYVEYPDGSIVDGSKLTTQERQQLLVQIRLSSNTSETIKLIHQCPKCQHINKDIQYDVSNIFVDFYEEDKNSLDYFEVADGNIRIHLGPLHRKDEITLQSYIKKKKITSDSEKQFTMLAGVIKKLEMKVDDVFVDVDISTEEKIDFFYKLNASDLDSITSYFEKIDFGVKMPLDFKCKNCDYENEENVNIAVFFIN